MYGKLISHTGIYDCYQFDTKNAYIYDINLCSDMFSYWHRENIAFIKMFQSYNTIVGYAEAYADSPIIRFYYDYNNRHYSKTTARQTTQFISGMRMLYNIKPFMLKEYDLTDHAFNLKLRHNYEIIERLFCDFRPGEAAVWSRFYG